MLGQQAVLLCCCIYLCYATTSKPNIVFIMADDLGWNDVGFHNPKVRTPNIDRLAERGIELTSNYASPICSASRAALMTGKYPSNNGVQHLVLFAQSKACLPLEHKLLPEYMKDEGYVTKMLGKWHLGYCMEECLPKQRGFDEFRGVLGGESGYYNWEQGGVVNKYINNTASIPNAANPTHLAIQDKIDVRDMILAHRGNANPLFMVVAPTTPHVPLQATTEMYNVHSFLNSRDPRQHQRRTYLGLVSALDDIVGATVQALTDIGVIDNTVIVFQSDNGGKSIRTSAGNNYPLRNGKVTPYEGGVRSPTIYVDPRLSRSVRGSDRDFLMHITDWLPTFLSLAHSSVALADIDGLSQLTNLGNTYDTEDRYSIREKMLVNMDTYEYSRSSYECTNRDAALRYKDWKLITGKKTTWTSDENPSDVYRKPEESPEVPTITGDSCVTGSGWQQEIKCLFNVRDDPSERHNKYDSEPDVVKQLQEMIEMEKCNIVKEVFHSGLGRTYYTTQKVGSVYIPKLPYCVSSDFPLKSNKRSCYRQTRRNLRDYGLPRSTYASCRSATVAHSVSFSRISEYLLSLLQFVLPGFILIIF
ncbi:arylsulfatase B-like [Watersipora subatra]|uniref:arylsulfatase B-like n=1 Tax=Watersipora subatra TaxID=2589382 RepID=UPI00355B7939